MLFVGLFHSFQYKQKHAILVETALLRDMPDALSSPFPELFYIQAKLANIKVSKIVHLAFGGPFSTLLL